MDHMPRPPADLADFIVAEVHRQTECAVGARNTPSPAPQNEPSLEQLRHAAGMEAGVVFARLSRDHVDDNEYFGFMSEFVNCVLALGVLTRFRTEDEFRARLMDYLSISSDPEVIELTWGKGRAGLFDGVEHNAFPKPQEIAR